MGKSSLFSPRRIHFTLYVIINKKYKKPIELPLQLAFVVKFDSRLSFTYLHSNTYLLLLSIDSEARSYSVIIYIILKYICSHSDLSMPKFAL